METSAGGPSRHGVPRPITASRPTTSIRPLTSTGLEAPKTSRGKTAFRRQIQDKSYWMALIKAKMTELSHEINRLSTDNEQMVQEEARAAILEKKAESLAKELAASDLELGIYNEFLDRQRMGDTLDDIQNEYESLLSQNHELSSRIEGQFEERTYLEDSINRQQSELLRIRQKWDQLKAQMDHSQRSQFDQLQNQLQRLSESAVTLETRVKQLIDKKRDLESSFIQGPDSFLRKELLSTLEKVRNLEQQRNDLLDETNIVDEKGRLLAQVKRDNQEIASMEGRISQITTDIDDLKGEIEAYEDTEAAEKYTELKKKEETMDNFLEQFDKMKREELNKCTTLGVSIYESLNRITRMVNHVDTLKAAPNITGSSKSASNIENLIDNKRKLELDLGKIEQLEVKINAELESLHSKIKTLEGDIKTYSDIGKLKKEMESKSEELKDSKDTLNERVAELKRSLENVKDVLTSKKDSLARNEIYVKMKNLETRLTELLSVNERIASSVAETDSGHLKKRVLEAVTKHNQKLQGFWWEKQLKLMS